MSEPWRMNTDQLARQHFESLSPSEKKAAVRRMVDDGHREYTIAAATELSVEMVRQILGQRHEAVNA